MSVNKLPRHETFFTYYYLLIAGVILGLVVHFVVFHVVPAFAQVQVTAAVECNEVNCACYE